MKMMFPLAAWLSAIALQSAHAAPRPVVLELFTSQSCSSCPPAEALLTALQAATPGVATLSFHVDYWNYLSWRDPFSSPQYTARQRAYAKALATEVYTPQLVIDGRASAVGSDRPAVLAAIDQARQAQQSGPPLSLTRTPAGLQVAAGAGEGQAVILLVGFDPAHDTRVAAGENGGVVLKETNVVRSLRQVGEWHGDAMSLTLPPPAGQKAALILQRPDGTIVGAAFL